MDELSKIGREVLIPAISGKIRRWLEQEVRETRAGDNRKKPEPETIH